MHLFQRVEGNLSFFFYLFFPVEKKKDILFWSLSFFQPNFITSLTMVHLSLELHTSGLKLTQNTCTGHVNRAISSYAQPPLAPPASNQNHHRCTPAAPPSSTITATVPLLSSLLQTTIKQWGNMAVGAGDTIKLGAVATKWRRKWWVWKIIICNDYLFLCNPNPMPPYIVVHNIGDDKRWKHSGEPSNGGRCMWRRIIFCNREVSSPLAAKDEEQGTHAKRREKNQGGSSARRKGTRSIVVAGWSLLCYYYYFGATSF